jgi:hypothetical protein
MILLQRGDFIFLAIIGELEHAHLDDRGRIYERPVSHHADTAQPLRPMGRLSFIACLPYINNQLRSFPKL